ncbi:MAG: transglycosylase SLT domain-containing protein [Bacteroidota bacterium]
MRKLLMLCCFACIALNLCANNTPPTFDEQEIIARIKAMKDDAVKARYTSIVKAYLKGYLHYRRSGSETILGRAVMYFPLFEEKLKEFELPDDLKYLSIVESALNPRAVSRAGAVGLWQFMPLTAKDMDLTINKYVDERRDPQKATQAAMRYLRMQYRRFGSWELALAAYNGGSGTVSRAIKRGRSKDFWRIRNYLPKETRNYVPAYIAACYLGKYYEKHELNPTYPDLDAQMTSTILVHGYLAFPKIAQLTGLSLEEIKNLNPAYKKNFIPTNKEGNTLTLPIRVMPSVQAYLASNQPDSGEKIEESELIASLKAEILSKDDFYTSAIYPVREGETIDSLAQRFQLRSHFIRAWNKMSPRMEIALGQKLVLYGVDLSELEQEVEAIVEEPIVRVEPVEELDEKPLDLVEEDKKLPPNTFERENYLYYTVGANENLDQIAEKFGDVSVRDIMILNNFRSTQIPRAGRDIKLKKM